jgi:serine/threonine-protein kinase
VASATPGDAGAPANGAVTSATPGNAAVSPGGAATSATPARAPAAAANAHKAGRDAAVASGTPGRTAGIARAPADAASTPRSGSSAQHLAARERDAHVAPASVDPTRAAAAAGSGWYAIDSTPYATVFIDDRKIGDTPLDRIALPTGAHRVRAVLADGRQRTFSIDIAPDRKTSSGTLTW